jgi:hypothetical protein
MNANDLVAFVTEIEGPYKSKIIFAVIMMLALFFTRFVFKTLKWVLAALILGVLIVLALGYWNR